MRCLDLLRRAILLDLDDLNYYYSSEAIAAVRRPAGALPRPGIGVRVGAFLVHAWRAARVPRSGHERGAHQRGAVMVFARTTNQWVSLTPVLAQLGDAYGAGESAPSCQDVAARFPLLAAHVVSSPFLPLVLRHYLRSKGYKRTSYRYAFDQYWLAYGYYLAAHWWLRRLAPAVVVLSNDHSMENRAVAHVARERHIPSVYIQHASVTERFPPLSFDYALLDGRDALEKYEKCGPSRTRVFLIGSPKADAFLRHASTRPQVGTIAICTNTVDPFDRVREVCVALSSAFPDLRLLLRPHPGDKRMSVWRDMTREVGLSFSDARSESAVDLLQRADVVIAAESSILLEAALADVFPIYYDLTGQHVDWYGFERHGLVQCVSDPGALCSTLKSLQQSRPPVRARARSYCATIGTAYEGRSAELAAGLVEEVAANGSIHMDRWRRIPGMQLEAYELCDARERDSGSQSPQPDAAARSAERSSR